MPKVFKPLKERVSSTTIQEDSLSRGCVWRPYSIVFPSRQSPVVDTAKHYEYERLKVCARLKLGAVIWTVVKDRPVTDIEAE